MVNELRTLLRDNAASLPHDDGDLTAVLKGGRRRVRRRRLTAVAGTAIAGAVVVGVTSLVWPSPPDLEAANVPMPDAPTMRLTDARQAVEGDDYRVLASYTNENLDTDNGQYFDGVTDDGLILFRDGPRMDRPSARYALLDPATDEKTWLSDPPAPEGVQLWPVALEAERLTLVGVQAAEAPGADHPGLGGLFAVVYDRTAEEWERLQWAGLPPVAQPAAGALGPDGRLYVRVPATTGEPPEGGWPTGPDGEADDADADGDTYRLWSVSLTDPDDVRDEKLTVGDVAFTDTSLVWTDATNGDAGLVHVRDLETGEEHEFDPQTGERCNLLSFGAAGQRIVMGQYCGTYDRGVRDDRVQVLSTDGEQVATLQDSGIEGTLAGTGDVVTVLSYQRGRSGTYVYDLGSDRFLRLSEDVSSWVTSGPTPPDHFLWNTPVNRGNGAKQLLGELID
jgi:hypothetical protein